MKPKRSFQSNLLSLKNRRTSFPAKITHYHQYLHAISRYIFSAKLKTCEEEKWFPKIARLMNDEYGCQSWLLINTQHQTRTSLFHQFFLLVSTIDLTWRLHGQVKSSHSLIDIVILTKIIINTTLLDQCIKHFHARSSFFALLEKMPNGKANVDSLWWPLSGQISNCCLLILWSVQT